MSALEIRNVQKTYGDVVTLRGIDIALESGEFLVLLGPSGCGKSTLLNIIAGLAEASEGDVLIGGKSVIGVHPKDRDIAMVFQSYALYPNLTVRRNIGFGLEMRKVPADIRENAVMEAAKLLKIEMLLDRKPGQLSGGQRQRVAIGRALVRKPQVFLFDEPLSNLDAKLRMETRTELKRLHQLLKTTVVYVTHDQIEAMTLATRIAVMRDGRIEQLGTPKEIYDKPASLYVAGFVGAPPMNLIDVMVRESQLAIAGTQSSIPLSADLVGKVRDGQKLILGVRPEALGLVADTASSVSLPATIEVSELTGPELMVTARLGEQRLTACVPARSTLPDGPQLPLFLDPAAIHLFDPETTRAISPG